MWPSAHRLGSTAHGRLLLPSNVTNILPTIPSVTLSCLGHHYGPNSSRTGCRMVYYSQVRVQYRDFFQARRRTRKVGPSRRALPYIEWTKVDYHPSDLRMAPQPPAMVHSP